MNIDPLKMAIRNLETIGEFLIKHSKGRRGGGLRFWVAKQHIDDAIAQAIEQLEPLTGTDAEPAQLKPLPTSPHYVPPSKTLLEMAITPDPHQKHGEQP